jgi:hypothetical protein
MAPVLVILQKHQFGTLDAARGPSTPSFDDLVGTLLEEPGYVQADCLRGFHVDRQYELGGGLHRQVAGLGATQDAIDIARGGVPLLFGVRPLLSECVKSVSAHH